MESSESPRFVRRYEAPLAALAPALDRAGARVQRRGAHELEATVSIPVGRLHRRLPMRLLLFGGPGTLAEMVPERSVRAGRAYFRAGNSFLDALAELR